jgi:hypothetical protein
MTMLGPEGRLKKADVNESSEALIYLAMIRIMVRRLA